MSQRLKAQEFLRKEGHGKDASAVTVKMGNKDALGSDRRTATALPAKDQVAYESGNIHPDDGLVRGHCRSA